MRETHSLGGATEVLVLHNVEERLKLPYFHGLLSAIVYFYKYYRTMLSIGEMVAMVFEGRGTFPREEANAFNHLLILPFGCHFASLKGTGSG